MSKIRCTLSTPVGGELGSIEGEVDQIKDTIVNWLENAQDGDMIIVKTEFEEENVDPQEGSNVIRPRFGSQQWAETYQDDIQSLDQPGDDFDAS